MKRSLLPLLAFVTLAIPAAAQTPARSTTTPTSPRAQPAQASPAQASPAQASPAQTSPAQALPQQTPPTPPQPGICCCRVWSHGWQYSWRPNGECTAQSGSCVTPDHC